MLEQITSFTQHFAIIIPVILGLVQVAKKAGLATRYSPLMSVLLGAVAGYLYIFQSTTGVLFGIVAGLSACGMWSSVRTTMELDKKNA